MIEPTSGWRPRNPAARAPQKAIVYDCSRGPITTFITDNKALMRRMHGTLVEPVADDEGTFQTPASTTFVKSVRSFRGLRFTRSTHEGKDVRRGATDFQKYPGEFFIIMAAFPDTGRICSRTFWLPMYVTLLNLIFLELCSLSLFKRGSAPINPRSCQRGPNFSRQK